MLGKKILYFEYLFSYNYDIQIFTPPRFAFGANFASCKNKG